MSIEGRDFTDIYINRTGHSIPQHIYNILPLFTRKIHRIHILYQIYHILCINRNILCYLHII